MPRKNHRSKLQFFRNLPSEIVIDILARLPIRTIVICKCVCRSWRDLLLTRDFVDFHLSKSVPGLVIGNDIYDCDSEFVKVFEFDDSLALEHHKLHYRPLTKIESKDITGSTIQGSANGLVLLHKTVSRKRDTLFVCNPITREYIELRYDKLIPRSTGRSTYGIGVSRMTGQFKVVWILHVRTSEKVTMSICLVYTLGTGMWRSIALPAPFLSDYDSIGVCLNGNLHWLVRDLDVSECILCFDLETETLSTFALPSPVEERAVVGLVALGDCLCLSDNRSEEEDEVVIWLMKEYGDEKSWTKEFAIRESHAVYYDDYEDSVVNPIKVFKDGDFLMAINNTYMMYYSNKTKTFKVCEVFGDEGDEDAPVMNAMLHTSSFFPLSSFANETVSRC